MQNGRQCIYRTGPSQRHLCRRTSFVGRRHVYSAAHRQSLQLALRRLHDKVEAARAALGAAPLTARFWREHRAEAALRPRFLVTAEEYARFSEALARALLLPSVFSSGRWFCCWNITQETCKRLSSDCCCRESSHAGACLGAHGRHLRSAY
uniref:Coiled-coil domain containing 84 n=1 Tax=Nothoprocta perdicaria TaxID=30464 RepID=A0A8C6YS90_NOTPE